MGKHTSTYSGLGLGVLLLSITCTVVYSQGNEIPIPEEEKVSEVIDDLGLSETVKDLSDIDSPDDVQQIADWKERCRIEVGDQAIKDIEDSIGQIPNCIGKVINWDKLQTEIDHSKSRGNLDLVFKKYCSPKYRGRFMACLEDLFGKLDVCMNDREREDMNVTRAAIDAGLDFVCYKDGDRIALFMGEHGGPCVESQKDNIIECVEDRVPEVKDSKKDISSIDLDKITINEANCKKVTTMHQCVVEQTSKCNDSTPANILDSLIVQMLKVTPCKITSGAPTLLASAHDFLPRLLTLFAAALTAANILL